MIKEALQLEATTIALGSLVEMLAGLPPLQELSAEHLLNLIMVVREADATLKNLQQDIFDEADRRIRLKYMPQEEKGAAK